MLRVERSVRGAVVVFAVSGRVGLKSIPELERIVHSEAARRNALNLKDVTLVDRHAVSFLARCEAEGTALENCPIYVREWILRERTPEETFTMKTMRETSGIEARTVHPSVAQRNPAQEWAAPEEEIRATRPFVGIIGDSLPLRDVLQQVEIVAPTDATVLVLGETGTGKELIARAIHDGSPRRERSFVKINCAAIPSGLLETELFGHERGAFTGAIARKIGRFEVADGGTLFLDEVGEIPLELQPKLLRVLQDQEFARVGGNRTIRVDVRLVAATNRELVRMVEEQAFRDDLYYRLNVFPIRVPSLRERPEDIEPLVRHFVQRFAARMQRQIDEIPTEIFDVMRRYPWPGNVRELENVIERAVILSPGRRLTIPLEHLARPSTPMPADDNASTLELVRRAHVVRVLEETNWVIGGPRGAAARLGMRRTTLQSLMKRYAIARCV